MPNFGSSVGTGRGHGASDHRSKPTFGRRLDGLAGRRNARRQRVILAASAQAIDCSRSVVVADLSHRGAKLQGRDLPPAGREVLITAGSIDVFATVAWSDNDECGLSFDWRLDDATLDALTREGKWAKVMGLV
jgi:hypothetical protein